MPRAADRFGAGARRRLDGGAHADFEAHRPIRPGEVYDRSLSFGLRQNELVDADSHNPRLEGGDYWGRHCVDEVRAGWAPPCNQSGVWLLWRGSGHEHEVERQCHAYSDEELNFHELRDDLRWRHLVGRHDGGEASRTSRLAATAVDGGFGTQSGPSQLPVYDPGEAMSSDRSGVGGPERRADRCDPVRRTTGGRDSMGERSLRVR